MRAVPGGGRAGRKGSGHGNHRTGVGKECAFQCRADDASLGEDLRSPASPLMISSLHDPLDEVIGKQQGDQLGGARRRLLATDEHRLQATSESGLGTRVSLG